MAECRVRIKERGEAQSFYGLWGIALDRSRQTDIDDLSRRYYQATASKAGEVLPFVVLCRQYEAQSGQCELFIGSTEPGQELASVTLASGFYAEMTIRPFLGRFWGAAIGRAKRWFYTKWLPESDYEAVNLEYEYHTQDSVGAKPFITLIFAIRPRER